MIYTKRFQNILSPKRKGGNLIERCIQSSIRSHKTPNSRAALRPGHDSRGNSRMLRHFQALGQPPPEHPKGSRPGSGRAEGTKHYLQLEHDHFPGFD